MFDISWYGQQAALVAMLLESIKRVGVLSKLKDELPPTAYQVVITGAALVLSMAIAFGARANVLLTFEVDRFAPVVGYVAGGLLIFGGNHIIDAVWDNRKVLTALLDVYKPNANVAGRNDTWGE